MATKKEDTVTKKTGAVKASSVKADTVKAEPVTSSTPEKVVEMLKE